MKLKLFLSFAVAMAAALAGAMPSATLLSAHQRYPWNNMVDVSFRIDGLQPGERVKCQLRVTTAPGGEEQVIPLPGIIRGNGARRESFEITEDPFFVKRLLPQATVRLELLETHDILPAPADAVGTPTGVYADVLVVDVSAGHQASEYPVSYYPDVDVGLFNCSTYKQNKIAMLWVPEGEYTIGRGLSSGVDDNYGEWSWKMTTAGYFLGMFPITCSQYAKVTGEEPVADYFRARQEEGYKGSVYDRNLWLERPVFRVSRMGVRGPGIDPVPLNMNGRFFERLMAKSKYGGERIRGFDLPTGHQWEIACRANTTTKFFWGNDLDLDALNTYALSYHQLYYKYGIAWPPGDAMGLQVVGGRRSNQWGFYDMAGSVVEWCRDLIPPGGSNMRPVGETDSTNADSALNTGDRALLRNWSPSLDYPPRRSHCWHGSQEQGYLFGQHGFRLSCQPDADVLVKRVEWSLIQTTMSNAFPLDTRREEHWQPIYVHSIDEILPVAVSGTDWGNGNGEAYVTGQLMVGSGEKKVLATVAAGVEDYVNVNSFLTPTNYGRFALSHMSSSPGSVHNYAAICVVPELVNDSPDTAIDLGSADSGSIVGFTDTATADEIDPYWGAVTMEPVSTVWYKWHPDMSSDVTITVDGDTMSVPVFDICRKNKKGEINKGYGLPYWEFLPGQNVRTGTTYCYRGEEYYICVGGAPNNDGYGGEGSFTLQWSCSKPRPPQDSFSTAPELCGLVGDGVRIDNTCCTHEEGEPTSEQSGISDSSRTAWYKYIPKYDGVLTLTAADPDRIELAPDQFALNICLGVYTSPRVDVTKCKVVTDIDGKPCCDYSDGSHDGISYTFNVTKGTVYYFQLAVCPMTVNDDNEGVIELSWQLNSPANADFANARELYRESGSVVGFTYGAGAEIGDRAYDEYGVEDTVWYEWTAPWSGLVRFDTYGSDFDTVMCVLEGGFDGETIAANDDAIEGGDGTSCVSFQAEAGVTYYIVVGGYAAGELTINWRMRFPYCTFVPSEQTMIFYFDDKRNFLPGLSYDIPDVIQRRPWHNDPACGTTRTVVFDPSFADFAPSSLHMWFQDFFELEEVVGMENLDTSQVKDFRYMFCFCKKLRSIDVSWFKFPEDTVVDLTGMFMACWDLTHIDLSAWKLEQAETLSMFDNSSINVIYATSAFAPKEGIGIVGHDMFRGCGGLRGGNGTLWSSEHVDMDYARVDGLDGLPGYFTMPRTAKVVWFENDNSLTFYCDYRSMEEFLEDCTERAKSIYGDDYYEPFFAVYEVDLESHQYDLNPPRWTLDGNDIQKVVFDESFRFARPKSLNSWFYDLDLTSVDGMEYLDTSNTIDMSGMFGYCDHLREIDLSHMDTSKVRNMSRMFEGCQLLEEIDVTGFDTSCVENMSGMFSGCETLTQLDVTGFDTSRVNDFSGMFYGLGDLEELDISSFTSDNSVIAEYMFADCWNLRTIYATDAFVLNEDDECVFAGSTELVGGNGTSNEEGDYPASYARIDRPGKPGLFTVKSELSGYYAWAASKGLSGTDAAPDAKPALWGGLWQNAFIYTYGEGLSDGSLSLLDILFDPWGRPYIISTPVVQGHDEFTPKVIGSTDLKDWSEPAELENDEQRWFLRSGDEANFFRVSLGE